MLMDALYCHPVEFTKSPLLPSIVQAVLGSLALELENPLTAVLHFLRDLLGYAVGHVPSAMESDVPDEIKNTIRGIISINGTALCCLLMSGMIFTFPRDCVTDGAGALMTLIEMDPESSDDWIADSLSNLPSGNFSSDECLRFNNQIRVYLSVPSRPLLTASAAKSKNYRRIQMKIEVFVALYHRRVISHRNKSSGKGIGGEMAFICKT